MITHGCRSSGQKANRIDDKEKKLKTTIENESVVTHVLEIEPRRTNCLVGGQSARRGAWPLRDSRSNHSRRAKRATTSINVEIREQQARKRTASMCKRMVHGRRGNAEEEKRRSANKRERHQDSRKQQCSQRDWHARTKPRTVAYRRRAIKTCEQKNVWEKH